MKEAGIPDPGSEDRWQLAMKALRGVWASIYNDRAFYSLRKVCTVPCQSVRHCIARHLS
jgi:hypothetical protein